MTRPRPRTALRTAKRVAERAHQKAARYARAGATIASPAFLPDELVIDLFAGGGGASCGIEAALGRPVDIAINHDAIAMAVHAANHPRTRHLISNVWEVDPVEACAGRRVGLLWASPDCTHHSRAKGAKPLSSKRRALASVVVRWARDVRPRVIVGENVAEFADWGHADDARPALLHRPVRRPPDRLARADPRIAAGIEGDRSRRQQRLPASRRGADPRQRAGARRAARPLRGGGLMARVCHKPAAEPLTTCGARASGAIVTTETKSAATCSVCRAVLGLPPLQPRAAPVLPKRRVPPTHRGPRR